jgi:hypothetical protein
MYRDRFQIQPIRAAADIREGTVFEFHSPAGWIRPGTARVVQVDVHFGVIQVEALLTTCIPGIAEGDAVHLWKMPCTRCRCETCEAGRATPPISEDQKARNDG